MKTVNISYTRREFYNFFVERIKKVDGFCTVENKETLYGLILDSGFVEKAFGDFIKEKIAESERLKREEAQKKRVEAERRRQEKAKPVKPKKPLPQKAKWEKIVEEKGENGVAMLSALSAEKNAGLLSYLKGQMAKK